MKGLSRKSQEDLRRAQRFVEDLWCIAQRTDKTEFDVFVPMLQSNALGLLKDAEPQDRALYMPEFKEAAGAGDRIRLARLCLKLIRAKFGNLARDDWLALKDKGDVFGQIRAKVSDQTIADAFNQPGLAGRTVRDRAKELEKAGYGRAAAIERRVSRMRKRGFEMALPPRKQK